MALGKILKKRPLLKRLKGQRKDEEIRFEANLLDCHFIGGKKGYEQKWLVVVSGGERDGDVLEVDGIKATEVEVTTIIGGYVEGKLSHVKLMIMSPEKIFPEKLEIIYWKPFKTLYINYAELPWTE